MTLANPSLRTRTTVVSVCALAAIFAALAFSRSDRRRPTSCEREDDRIETIQETAESPSLLLRANEPPQRSPGLGADLADPPRAACDPLVLFERDHAALRRGDPSEPTSPSRTYPSDWLREAWTCALENDLASQETERGTRALSTLAAKRFLLGTDSFRQACLVEAFSRLCGDRFEPWQEILTAGDERLARLEEGLKAMVLARMPAFHEHAAEPPLPGMIRGAIALAQSSDDCCGETRSGFAFIVEKFPSAPVRQVAEDVLIAATVREADLDQDARAVGEVCGALRMLAALVEGSRMSIEDALVATIRAGSEQLAECSRASTYYFRLLDMGMEQRSSLALDEALRLASNTRLDAGRVAFLLSDYASLADVQTWLADAETRDQALSILIALPLGARPSTDELRSIVHSATGRTYLLALKAYLGPIEPARRDEELAAEYGAATTLEDRLGILEVADFYRRPTLECALLERVSSDPEADPRLRARASELTKRFMDSLVVNAEKR